MPESSDRLSRKVDEIDLEMGGTVSFGWCEDGSRFIGFNIGEGTDWGYNRRLWLTGGDIDWMIEALKAIAEEKPGG